MLSPYRKKMTKNDDTRSPSIPTEIATGGFNHHAYFLEDSGESDHSAACLGISRPSYDCPDQLDFSPVFQSRKRMSKTKSALDKYQNKSSSSGLSSSIASTKLPTSHIEVITEHISEYKQTQKNDSNESKSAKQQSGNSPFKSLRKMQRNRASRKNEKTTARITSSKNTAPLRNPIKALKMAKSSSSSTTQVQSHMDGSIDLHKSFPTEHENAIRTNGHTLRFDNERFFTPAQQAGTPNHIHQTSSHSSVTSVLTTDSSPLLVTHPMASSMKNQSQGLGITRAPRSSTKRIVVPHVKPSKNKNIYTIFVLLIQPSQKIFELVRLNYNPTKTTLRKLLQMIPANCTEEDLSNQVYTGFCRPNSSSSSNKSLLNLTLTASVMARDGSCARIICGEVLAAIPEGYTSKETQILARHIMKNPKMVKLLSKKNTLTRSYSNYLAFQNSGENREKVKCHLGIQPRSSRSIEDDIDRFSSSVMFTPLTDTIAEETCNDIKGSNDYKVKKRMKSPRGKLAAKLEHDKSGKNLISGDNSCNSSITSIHSLQRSHLVQKVVTNIEMKNKLSKLEDKVSSSKPTTESTKKLPQDLSVEDDEISKNDKSQQEVSLCASQLDAIKREAAQAARVAAEEAFAKRMEELVKNLDVSDEQKIRLLEDDDMSYHSAMSFAMNGSFSSLPTKETCEFPVSVTVSAHNPPPVVETSILSPYGSYGAYASELSLTSPFAPSSGLRLLTPIASSQRFPGPVLSPVHVVSSPETIDNFSPRASDPMKFSDSMLKYQDSSVNKTMNTTYTQSSDESEDDMQSSLLSEAMEGFIEVTKTAVSKFVDRRKKDLGQLPSKIVERKLHLKIMSIVCLMYLSSQSMNMTSDEDLDHIFNFQNETHASSPTEDNDGKRNFSIVDLQQILFWFLLFTKGQQFLSESRPRRRRRRAWKSRVVPVKPYQF